MLSRGSRGHRFLLAKRSTLITPVENGWEGSNVGAEERLDRRLVILAKNIKGAELGGGGEDGQMSVELRDTWVPVWLWGEGARKLRRCLQ